MRSRIPENRYFEKVSRKPSTLTIMPTTTLLTSHGVLGGVSPMWCETGRPAASISSHTGLNAVLP